MLDGQFNPPATHEYLGGLITDPLLALIAGVYTRPDYVVEEAKRNITDDFQWKGTWLKVSVDGGFYSMGIVDPEVIEGILGVLVPEGMERQFFNNPDLVLQLPESTLQVLTDHCILIPISPSGQIANQAIEKLGEILN